MGNSLAKPVKDLLLKGTVIPAHPLALDTKRKLDVRYQRALTRYYMDAGAGGVAVGVHTTQFEIREPKHDLYHKVLALAATEIGTAKVQTPFIKVAGVVGPTEQAVAEAKMAKDLGYDLVLVSNGGLSQLSETQLMTRIEHIAEVLPVFGFYLQPAVGGRVLSFDFWKVFASHPNVHAIKVAAFNRYQTLDVIRAVCLSGRADDIAMYTGNDDNIVADLLTPYRFTHDGIVIEKRFTGGLLGHWAFWTHKAVALLKEIHQLSPERITGLLTKGIAITDANAAVFDPANAFHGCISGINEVLRRQGLLPTNLCLVDSEKLSPGQSQEINRVHQAYPELHDDEFVSANLDRWLS